MHKYTSILKSEIQFTSFFFSFFVRIFGKMVKVAGQNKYTIKITISINCKLIKTAYCRGMKQACEKARHVK